MSAWSATAAALIVTAGLALLTVGCGGSPGAPAASAQQRGALAYAGCMRADGVSNWPDPNASGVFDKLKLTTQQLGASSSHVQTAQRACNHLLPNGGSGRSSAQMQQMRAQGLRFSLCVRSHGLANFPDPDSSGRIPDPAPLGIDQGSPKFRAANQACRNDRPAYIPSNAAYDAYVRAHG